MTAAKMTLAVMMSPAAKANFGFAILPAYCGFALAIGWFSRRKAGSANSYLNASRSLPLWVVVAAYLAANCGALEVVGLSAMAAQYGVQALHFYFIGAIPALIFLALFVMPVYRSSGLVSMPDYLEKRYSRGVRLLNACILAVMMLLLAGISLYALAQMLEVIAGIGFVVGITASAGVVLAYVLLGGVRATIYNEVFQLVVMLAGLVPLAWRCRHLSGATTATLQSHLWLGTPAASHNAPLDGVGLVFGLGFVLSFGYWCTDFVQMQRTFASRTDLQARQVPLWAGFGKLVFSLLVIVPGLAAAHLVPALGHTQRFDQALPAVMKTLYGPAMLGLGLTAIVAGLMSGLAANVSAFAAICTQDIYRVRLRPAQAEAHYLFVGRLASVAAILLAAFASYLNFFFGNLMEHVQLISSIFASPFWAAFLLGMTTRKANARGVFAGILFGTGVVLLHLLAASHRWIRYGSVMNADFHGAIYGFCTTIAVTLACSHIFPSEQPSPSGALRFRSRAGFSGQGVVLLWVLAGLLLTACASLNYAWR